MKNLFIIINLFFLIFSKTSFAESYATISSDNADAEIQRAILFYVNDYRAKHGLKPLQLSSLMSAVAKEHSMAMATHHRAFGHKNFPARVKRLYSFIPNCQGAAENVAFNYKNIQNLVYLWTKSPGHKQNIRGNYNLTGIGIARDSQGKPYYTQIFIKKA